MEMNEIIQFNELNEIEFIQFNEIEWFHRIEMRPEMGPKSGPFPRNGQNPRKWPNLVFYTVKSLIKSRISGYP